MFDTITKALTIQISADDLTGGAWSSIGGAAKDLMNLATPFNQAWELASKVVNTVAAGLEKPIQMLSEGGELSEARAGVEALGQSFEVNSARMLESIRDLSDGSLNITQAMQATGDAIRRGFSEDQVETIFAFAQKFVDTMGDSKGGVLEVATKIEEAIFTGKGKGAKDFGLNIAVGTAFSDIEAQMQRLTEKMGDGAFNFGDSMEKMATAAADAGMRIKEELNNLVGREGFEDFETGLRAQFRTVEAHAEEIATAIFFPINEAWKIFSEHFLWIFDALDVGFNDTDTLGQKLVITIQTIGNTAGETAKVIGDAIGFLLTPLNEITKGIYEANTAILEMRLSAKQGIFGASEEDINRLKVMIEESKALAAGGLFKVDTSGITKALGEYNKKIAEAGKAFVESKDQAELFGETIDEITDIIGDADAGLDNLFEDATDGADKFTSGIETAGESFAKTSSTIEKNAKAASKAMREWIEIDAELSKASVLVTRTKGGGITWDFGQQFGGSPLKTSGSPTSGGNTAQKAQSARGGTSSLKVSLQGIDPKLADFVEYIIDRVTQKAIAEGVITAGV